MAQMYFWMRLEFVAFQCHRHVASFLLPPLLHLHHLPSPLLL